MSGDTSRLYPSHDDEFYGCAVWAMGEYGDEGLLVEGHSRRALAAANAHGRHADSVHWSAHLAIRVERVWLLVVEECGCTPDEHEAHAVYEDPGQPWYDCDSCEHWGLPPCRDIYGWKTLPADADTNGALPFTRVSW